MWGWRGSRHSTSLVIFQYAHNFNSEIMALPIIHYNLSTKIMLSHTSIHTNIPPKNVFLTKEKPSKCCTGAVVALGGAIFILATKPGPGVVVFMTLVGLTILFFDQAWGENGGGDWCLSQIHVFLKYVCNTTLGSWSSDEKLIGFDILWLCSL